MNPMYIYMRYMIHIIYMYTYWISHIGYAHIYDDVYIYMIYIQSYI